MKTRLVPRHSFSVNMQCLFCFADLTIGPLYAFNIFQTSSPPSCHDQRVLGCDLSFVCDEHISLIEDGSDDATTSVERVKLCLDSSGDLHVSSLMCPAADEHVMARLTALVHEVWTAAPERQVDVKLVESLTY